MHRQGFTLHEIESWAFLKQVVISLVLALLNIQNYSIAREGWAGLPGQTTSSPSLSNIRILWPTPHSSLSSSVTETAPSPQGYTFTLNTYTTSVIFFSLIDHCALINLTYILIL